MFVKLVRFGLRVALECNLEDGVVNHIWLVFLLLLLSIEDFFEVSFKMHCFEEISVREYFGGPNVKIEVPTMLSRIFWHFSLGDFLSHNPVFMVRVQELIFFGSIESVIRLMIRFCPSEHVLKSIFCSPLLEMKDLLLGLPPSRWPQCGAH